MFYTTYDLIKAMPSDSSTSEASNFHYDTNHNYPEEATNTSMKGMIDQGASVEGEYNSEEYGRSFVWYIEPNSTWHTCV